MQYTAFITLKDVTKEQAAEIVKNLRALLPKPRFQDHGASMHVLGDSSVIVNGERVGTIDEEGAATVWVDFASTDYYTAHSKFKALVQKVGVKVDYFSVEGRI